eukprot:650864_1
MAHLFCMLQVALIFHLLCIPKALEFIVNPSSWPLSCGTNDNCTVICNATESCRGKSFYFYDNTIDLHCSAKWACRAVKIFTSNVQSFTATMTDESSFIHSTLYTSKTDIDVHVNCGPSSNVEGVCESARFYYLNQGQSTHNCELKDDCRKTMVYGISAVTLVCKEPHSCYRTSFVLPSDEQLNQQSSLTVFPGGTYGTIKVFSLYPFNNFISVDGATLDGIYFVYGMRFNQYCIASDTLCMSAVPANIASYDELTIIHTYPDGIPSQSLSYNGDVLVFAILQTETFTSPSIRYT